MHNFLQICNLKMEDEICETIPEKGFHTFELCSDSNYCNSGAMLLPALNQAAEKKSGQVFANLKQLDLLFQVVCQDMAYRAKLLYAGQKARTLRPTSGRKTASYMGARNGADRLHYLRVRNAGS